jgi:hypothetical protein
MARARAPGSLLFYFCQLYRASSCWYFCWYRQQRMTEIILNSISYGIKRLSAGAPTGLFKPVPKRSQPSAQCSETLEK